MSIDLVRWLWDNREPDLVSGLHWGNEIDSDGRLSLMVFVTLDTAAGLIEEATKSLHVANPTARIRTVKVPSSWVAQAAATV